jgi:ATP-dependent DNA helicase RecG
MLKPELFEIIANGESSGIEFKRDDLRPEQLAKEIVALANFEGGRVFIGVEDDGTISGIQRENLEAWVMDTVFGRYVHPMILPFYEEVALGDGKRVAVVSIGPGTAKPYVVRSGGREDIYVRVGSTSRLATREQQARLFAAGGLLHAEALPVSGTGLADLSLDRLEDYLRHVVGDSEVPSEAAAWIDRLALLGLMTGPAGGGFVCSLAGLLLFGRAPRRALPQAGARLLVFAGDSKEYEALDDAVIDGPLVPLTRRGVEGARSLIEPGLLERLMDRLRPFVSSDAGALADGLRRERRWHVPVEALREAVVNAFAHRDWTRLPEVEVAVFADRIEVTSPGALTNSMTVPKMLAGQRAPRNTTLVEVLRDYGYVEARGMGVRRKIVPLVREHSGQDARFEATEDFVRVTLPMRRGAGP